MKVYKSLEEFSPLPHAVVTQGTFDGVHIGHQKIIEQVANSALQKQGETVLLTFFPHPRMVLQPEDNNLRLLHTQEEKIEHIAKAGIQHLLIIPFTKEFSRQTSLQFVRDVLVGKIGVKTLVIGYDHRFGKNREGSMDNLRNYGNAFGFEVEEIPPQDIEATTVSSTKIRNALLQGDVATANKYLGYSYTVSGKVVAGNSLGKKIGYPTANIFVQQTYKLIPADGVYAVQVHTNGQKYFGMANIGHQPTFSNRSHAVEVNIFNFNSDIYGQELTISFEARIRSEMKFSGTKDLIEQLGNDKTTALQIFKQL